MNGGTVMFSFSRKTSVATFAILSLLVVSLLSGCGQQAAAPKQAAPASTVSGSITVVGSTALMPLVEVAAKNFTAANAQAKVPVQGGGSGTGLTQVAGGAAAIGMSDIFAEEKDGIDAKALVDTRVCVVGFAAVVNPNVKVDNLTKKQLIDLFTGKVTNWKQVGGADVKVAVINRTKGSGTRATFDKWALDGATEVESTTEDSSGAVRKMVAETPGAISYLALSYVDKTVVALKLDGVTPTKDQIVTGKYPVWSYEHMYTKGQPDGLARQFLAYMVTADVQNRLVPDLGYIAITDMKINRDATSK
jgi:phosphate transport system substrate-binding protein